MRGDKTMTTKDWQAEVEAAARAKREEILKLNPNGFTVAPYVNGDIIESIFEEAASWAREKAKEREAKLVEALEKIDSMERSRGYPTGMEWMTIVGEVRAALKAWRGEKCGAINPGMVFTCHNCKHDSRDKYVRDTASDVRPPESISMKEAFELTIKMFKDTQRELEAVKVERDELRELVRDAQKMFYDASLDDQWFERAARAFGDNK